MLIKCRRFDFINFKLAVGVCFRRNKRLSTSSMCEEVEILDFLYSYMCLLHYDFYTNVKILICFDGEIYYLYVYV